MGKSFQYSLIFLIALSLTLSACSKSKTVEEYLQDGQNHLEDDDVSKAIASLEEVLKREPGQAEAHRLLGEALSRDERWPEAVAQFEAYVSLARDDAAAYFSLGQAYVQTGDVRKAAEAFAEGARVDPATLSSHNEEIAAAADDILAAGREALESGDLSTATELLSIVAPLVPGQGDVYALLGEAHLKANDVSQALGAFATALELSPELSTEFAAEIESLAQKGMEMGQAALDAGDLTGAAQTLNAATKLLPDDPKLHFLLGNVYNQANQFAQAIAAYESVLNLEPESSSAHTNMGVVFYKMGDLETAQKEYIAALDIEPDDAETHYLLGAAYVQQEQLEQGQEEFETALELDDKLAPPYIGLGNIKLLQGDLNAALEMADQAIALTPDSPEAYFLLGQVHIQLGNIADARAAMEEVLLLNPAPQWREQVERIIESLDSD